MLTIWWAWRWRNNMILDSSCWSVNYVVRCIYLDALNLHLALSSDFQLTPTLFPLDSSTVHLNVDGCWFSDQSRLGFGGLIRDVSGHWLAGFSGNSSHGDPSLAELLAILEGLKIAWHLGFKTVQCMIDSMDIVQSLLHRDQAYLHSHASYLFDIFSLVDKPWTVNFLWIDRDSNCSADALAKLGALSSPVFEYWTSPPPSVLKWLLLDVVS
uniref:Ribonuclease H protein At1g65750 family n=1 Tax=Cajanus cajan TaxID=3821 RepID=A0A151T938_CAJCA|nr:Putative ribonuclease H protein At1g65750 family [Cajanus cajan]